MSAIASLPAEGFVKAASIAKIYNVTTPTVYKWERERKIPGIRFEGTVRFDLSAVRATIEGSREEAK